MATGDDENDVNGDGAVGDNDDDDGNNDDGDDNNDDDGDGDGAMGSGATGYNHDNDLGSGLALACCSIVAPPAASPCALSICISVRSFEAFQKLK